MPDEPDELLHLDLVELAGAADYSPAPAAEPTDALAGSPEKLEIIRQRIARGEEAFHPGDNPRLWPPN